MRTTCGHPRRQPRAGTRNAPVDPAPPVRRGARPGGRCRAAYRKFFQSYGEWTYLPVAEGRSRTGIRDVTILFDTVATLKVPPTTWVRRSALLQCSRGPRRSIDARAPHIVSCAGANGGTGEPAL